MPRKTSIINTIDGTDYDADNFSPDVYDLIIQSYEIVQNLPGVNAITVDVQSITGTVHSINFAKDESEVSIRPEGLALHLVQ